MIHQNKRIPFYNIIRSDFVKVEYTLLLLFLLLLRVLLLLQILQCYSHSTVPTEAQYPLAAAAAAAAVSIIKRKRAQ